MNDDATDPKVSEAARWLASLAPKDKPHPVIPELRRRFALSARDACLAAAKAAKVPAGGGV